MPLPKSFLWSVITLTPKPCVWHWPVCSHHQHKNAASLLSNHFVYKTEASLESLITPYDKHSFHFKEEIFFSYLDLDIVYSWIRQLSSVSSCVNQKLWFFYRLCVQERFVSKQCFCWFYCWFCCLSSQKKKIFQYGRHGTHCDHYTVPWLNQNENYSFRFFHSSQFLISV